MIIVFLGTLLTACTDGAPSGDPANMTDASEQEKLAELGKRPDIDAMLDRYERLRTEIRARLVDEVGLPEEWELPESAWESENPCSAPYSTLGEAVSVNMVTWVHDDPIPENRWSQAQEVLTEVTAGHGFDQLQVVVDGPGDHLVRVYDSYGGGITLGTKKATILSSGTGCHLVPAVTSGSTPAAPAGG
ncbi:LppA family lipoprotein [Saccharomonospora iraqiensis]|uniref:LppA family lipoprotein n=1 Tax=Saccharomonospora iraqiensis TaxID=52698 RepID=UPI001378095E|nr:LppA family lipoprotein [Saccharomonospora iraqiensis]